MSAGAGEGYLAPRECPVCSEDLHVTRLGCSQCGTALSGHFRSCEFCGLSDGDRELLRVFLTSRGNMRDLERHLAVSYPTARARFDELLRRLGYQPVPATGNNHDTLDGAAGSVGPGSDSSAEGLGQPQADPRLAVLQALAAGEIDVDGARRRL